MKAGAWYLHSPLLATQLHRFFCLLNSRIATLIAAGCCTFRVAFVSPPLCTAQLSSIAMT